MGGHDGVRSSGGEKGASRWRMRLLARWDLWRREDVKMVGGGRGENALVATRRNVIIPSLSSIYKYISPGKKESFPDYEYLHTFRNTKKTLPQLLQNTIHNTSKHNPYTMIFPLKT